MNVTLFKNFNEVEKKMPLSAVLALIRDGSYRAPVEALRKLVASGDRNEYDRQKKSLPAFTPSATFEGGRKQQYIEQYSGLVVLDIDKLIPEQLDDAFQRICGIPYTYACFRSPSNNGLKVLVISDAVLSQHKKAFNEIKEHYESTLQLVIDKSGKDVTRLCFVSWDPELYINENSQIFNTSETMLKNEVEYIIQKIEEQKADITNSYANWLTVGFALADAFGPDGRHYFHLFSKFNHDYNCENCNVQYDKCLNAQGHGVTIKSLFYLAKQHGIDISQIKSVALESEVDKIMSEEPKNKEKKKKKKNLFDVIEKFLLRTYTLRYNVVTAKIEIKHKDQPCYESMTDYLENSIYRQLHKNNIHVSMAKLRAILQSDFCSFYDPFHEYLKNLPPWDGETDYIAQLAGTVTTNNDVLWQTCFKKWIVAVVASLLNPKVVNHTAIIFSGAQGIGKTTWMENLCPPELKNHLFSGTINPNNKDTLVHLTECMLINMDELENMNRTEIGTLKEIITKSAIRIRRSYGHNNESLIRRASFMGSVNTSQFLNDSTGSRRFLFFEAINIEYQHNIDIRLVYAQACKLYEEGFRFYFDKSEVDFISDNNEKYQIRTAEEELLLTWFKPVPLDEANYFLSATQIIAKLAEKTRLTISTGSLISLGKALKKHGFSKTKKNGVYVWGVKELTYVEVETNACAKPKDEPF